MAEPIGIAAASLAVLGEGILLWGLFTIQRQVRHLDDEGPARLLLVAMPLVALGAVLRIYRYATGTRGSWDTYLGLLAGATGWFLAWRALATLPGSSGDLRNGTRILVATAVAAVLLAFSFPAGLVVILVLLSLGVGFTGAFLAGVGWRLRAAGGTGWVPSLAVASGLLLALAPWLWALLLAGALGGDATLLPVSRLEIASFTLLAALFSWPAIGALSDHFTPVEPPKPDSGAPAPPTEPPAPEEPARETRT